MIPQDMNSGILVMIRVLTRRDFDDMRALVKACPGSKLEHLEAGLYVVLVPAGSLEAA